MNTGYFEALTCNICVCFTIINHLKNHMKRVKGAAASLRKVHQVVFNTSCHNWHLSATGWFTIHRIQERMRGESRKGKGGTACGQTQGTIMTAPAGVSDLRC